jgi:hypothetical protein
MNNITKTVTDVIKLGDPNSEIVESIRYAFSPAPAWVRLLERAKRHIIPEQNVIFAIPGKLLGRWRATAIIPASVPTPQVVADAATSAAVSAVKWVVIPSVVAVSSYFAYRWYARTSSLSIVQVDNTGIELTPADAVAIFDGFEPAADDVTTKNHIVQRIADYYLRHGLRYRDVGGDPLVSAEHGAVRHVCPIPHGFLSRTRPAQTQHPAADSCLGFESCDVSRAFPAALLAADVFVDRRALSKLVRGHTFIVVPNDTRDSEKYHRHGPFHQSKDRSPVEEPQPHHHWAMSGFIIDSCGAANYHTILSVPGFSVIYAFPASGSYCSDDLLNLTSSVDRPLVRLSSGNTVFIQGDVVVFTTPQRTLAGTYPSTVFQQTVARCGGAVRDEKFLQTISSYLTAKINALDTPIHDAADVSEAAAFMCSRYALDYYSRNVEYYDPAHLSIYRRCILSLNRAFRNARLFFLHDITCQLLSHSFAGRLAPWSFVRVTIPAYVQHPRLRLVNLRDVNPGNRPFLHDRVIPHAQPDDRQRQRAGGLRGEPDIQHRNQGTGAQAVPNAAPHLHEEARTADVHARHQSPPFTPEPHEIHEFYGLGMDTGSDCEDTEFISCAPASTSSDELSGGASGSILKPCILLAKNSRRGTARLIIPALDDPVPVPSQYARLCTRETVLALSDRLYRSSLRGWDATQHVVYNYFKSLHHSPRHSPEAACRRISQDSSDEVGAQGDGAYGLPKVVKAIPVASTSRTSDRERESSVSGHSSVSQGEELREERDNAQVRRPKKHKPEKRRVPRNSRPVHRRNRK